MAKKTIIRISAKRAQVKRPKQHATKRPHRSMVVSSLPATIGMRIGGARPQSTQIANNGMRIAHKEFLMELRGVAGTVTNDTFTLKKIPINAGLTTTFRWLANLARNYENYVFESLHFEFVTCTTTTASGTIMMALDFDVNDPVPQDKQAMMDFQDSVRFPIWNMAKLAASPKNLHKYKEYFCRYGSETAVTDLKTMDVCNFLIGSADTNISLDALFGEVYVSYVVRLITPQASSLAEEALSGLGQFKGAYARPPETMIPTTDRIAGTLVDYVGEVNTGVNMGGRINFREVGDYLVNWNTDQDITVGTGIPDFSVAANLVNLSQGQITKGLEVIKQTYIEPGKFNFKASTQYLVKIIAENTRVDLRAVVGAINYASRLVTLSSFVISKYRLPSGLLALTLVPPVHEKLQVELDVDVLKEQLRELTLLLSKAALGGRSPLKEALDQSQTGTGASGVQEAPQTENSPHTPTIANLSGDMGSWYKNYLTSSKTPN